jgi:hypothetical protein
LLLVNTVATLNKYKTYLARKDQKVEMELDIKEIYYLYKRELHTDQASNDLMIDVAS